MDEGKRGNRKQQGTGCRYSIEESDLSSRCGDGLNVRSSTANVRVDSHHTDRKLILSQLSARFIPAREKTQIIYLGLDQ